MWAQVAGIGLSALGSFLGSDSTAKYQARMQNAMQGSQAYLGGISELRSLSNMLATQKKQNEAVMQADEYNFVNTQYQTGLAQLQDALSRKAAGANRSLVRRAEVNEVGSIMANSAAAGVVGASVDSVLRDVQKNTERSLVDVDGQRELERNAYYQEVYTLYTGYYQNQQEIDDTLPDVPDDPRVYPSVIPKGPSFGQHLAGAAINAGVNHFQAKAKLDLGPKPYSVGSQFRSGGTLHSPSSMNVSRSYTW